MNFGTGGERKVGRLGSLSLGRGWEGGVGGRAELGWVGGGIGILFDSLGWPW